MPLYHNPKDKSQPLLHSRTRLNIFLLLLLVVILTGGIGTGYLINVKSSNDSTNSELVSIIPKLDEVFRFINARYWEEVDVVELENKGLKGILQKLKLDSEKKNIELNFEDKIDSSTRENRVEEGIGFI